MLLDRGKVVDPRSMGASMEIAAAVLREPGGIYRIETVNLAEPDPDEVLVRVVGAGMCHTDVVPRAPESPAPPPIITGHEGAGVVEAVGRDVTGVSVGDHVVLSFDSCGTCVSCQRGRPSYCDTFVQRNLVGRRVDGTTGVTDADGDEVSSRWFGQSSFATHCIATARNVVVVDPDLPLEKLGPLGCGILTGAGSILVALDVEPERSLVVFGSGAVGLAAIMAGKVVGASPIVAVDIHAHRLALAAELGATHTIDGTADDLVEQIQAITGGGVDYAFDTTGNVGVIVNALASLRMGGQCGLVGIQSEPLVLDPLLMVGKTVSHILEGSAVPQETIPRLISLWREGRFPFDRLTEVFSLDDINLAEEASLTGKVVKPILVPGPWGLAAFTEVQARFVARSL